MGNYTRTFDLCYKKYKEAQVNNRPGVARGCLAGMSRMAETFEDWHIIHNCTSSTDLRVSVPALLKMADLANCYDEWIILAKDLSNTMEVIKTGKLPTRHMSDWTTLNVLERNIPEVKKGIVLYNPTASPRFRSAHYACRSAKGAYRYFRVREMAKLAKTYGEWFYVFEEAREIRNSKISEPAFEKVLELVTTFDEGYGVAARTRNEDLLRAVTEKMDGFPTTTFYDWLTAWQESHTEITARWSLHSNTPAWGLDLYVRNYILARTKTLDDCSALLESRKCANDPDMQSFARDRMSWLNWSKRFT